MTAIARIDRAIQKGRGKAANKLGQTYDVRRLSKYTNVSIMSNPAVIPNFPARIRRTTLKVAIENNPFDLLVFQFTCTNLKLEIGDVFQETGYGSDGGIFTLAQKRPTRETLCMSTPFNVFITRPEPSAGQAAQQPDSGNVFTAGYGGIDIATEEVLTLTNGYYSFQPKGVGVTAAGIQAGLQQSRRAKDSREPQIPTAQYRDDFLIYLPLLPGEQIRELDRVNFGNSDRYQMVSVFSSSTIGLSGYICLVERLAN